MRTIWHYKDHLPPVEDHCKVQLGEGQTPLIRSRYIGPLLGLHNLYFKLENLNPTGSYKDRFAAAFIGSLLQKGAPYCIATSSGNTGSALAAYCAAANTACYIVVVDNAPADKIRQMQLYGARTLMVEGFGLDTAITNAVFSQLEKRAAANNLSLPISAYRYCPEGMVGVQTIAYEVLDELQGNVQHIFSPAGGGGLTLAIANGVIAYLPYTTCKVHCVQPEGNNTIAGALKSGAGQAQEVPRSTTKVSGLQVPGVLDGTDTLLRCRQTGGTGFLVTDEQVFEMQQLLACKEGVFCEAAGAVSVSALKEALDTGQVSANDTIVCVITGSGFKDMSAPARQQYLVQQEEKFNMDTLLQFLATIQKHDAL